MAISREELPQDAILWHGVKGSKDVCCDLCRFNCLIKQGDLGSCGVRKNIDGKLYSLNYDKVCAMADDPIEKKPLYHFHPGSMSLSISTPGCNFKCEFCQNWQISQIDECNLDSFGNAYSPAMIVHAAQRQECKSISYTYTEPTVFYELCNDCGLLAREKGIFNVFVSNGYMSEKTINHMGKWLDAINVDIKSFDEEFYSKVCKSSLKQVLDSVEYIASNTNIWMELTTLIVPGKNDDMDSIKRLIEFIIEKAGPSTPWHISKFYPMYHMKNIQATPLDTLLNIREIAREAGLKYVYIGNVPQTGLGDTNCPNCGKVVVERQGYSIVSNVVLNGCCPDCATAIAGIW